jgi:hypothetical protein
MCARGPSSEANLARGGAQPSSEADLARGGAQPSSEADLARGGAQVGCGGHQGCEFKWVSPGCLGDPYGCP